MMNAKSSLIALAVFTLTLQPTWAAETSLYLLWKDKPVQPLCIDALFPMEGEGPGKVDLNTCGQNDKGEPLPLEYRSADAGMLSTTEEVPEGESPPYVAYKLNGKTDEGYVISNWMSGGGTGIFSGVSLIALEGDNLVLKRRYDGGDRCNGGISKVEVKGNDVHVFNHITPGDFTVVAYGNDKGIRPYEDLEASAGSCFAETEIVNDKLARIILDKSAVKTSEDNRGGDEWTSRYQYQKCFNGLFSEQVARKSELTHEEFKAFMDGFLKTCVKA